QSSSPSDANNDKGNSTARPSPNPSLRGRGVVLNTTGAPPRQMEFARLNLTYTVMSKRKLLELVKEKHVHGWDDPRMPTLSGMRRRGYPAAAIRAFCDGVGVARRDNTIELARLEFHVREELNKTSPRVMGVLNPLKVVIENYPEGETDELDAINNPEDASAGSRKVPFSKVIYIEQEDFAEVPPPKYFRLAPGVEVRLRYAYFIRATKVVKDEAGNVIEVHATYDPATRGGDAPDKRKVKGTIHWVSAEHAVDAEVRLYETLFNKEDAEDVPEGGHWHDNLNPDSLKTLTGCKLEPSVKSAKAGDAYQLERTGYFSVDADSSDRKLILNRTVTLKDSWAKVQKKG
ncbi:MAG: glutamate--tRNA ligase family protein, partial [Phycisphaeraceae bacterium]